MIKNLFASLRLSGEKKPALLATLLLLPALLFSQCFKGNTAVGTTEFCSYDVSYSISAVWTNIANVTFTTAKEQLGGKDVLHFKCAAKTYPTYDHLFKVRDYYESWVSVASFTPVKYNRYTVHDENTILSTQYYYPTAGYGDYSYKLNNDPVEKGKVTLGACMFDMISAVFYFRTLQIENLRPGTVLSVDMLYGTNPYTLALIAAGKEVIRDRKGKMYHCSKFRIKVPAGISLFKANSEVIVYLTADKNKIPVYIEAVIKVGTVKVYLTEARGLLNPMTALLTK